MELILQLVWYHVWSVLETVTRAIRQSAVTKTVRLVQQERSRINQRHQVAIVAVQSVHQACTPIPVSLRALNVRRISSNPSTVQPPAWNVQQKCTPTVPALSATKNANLSNAPKALVNTVDCVSKWATKFSVSVPPDSPEDVAKSTSTNAPLNRVTTGRLASIFLKAIVASAQTAIPVSTVKKKSPTARTTLARNVQCARTNLDSTITRVSADPVTLESIVTSRYA